MLVLFMILNHNLCLIWSQQTYFFVKNEKIKRYHTWLSPKYFLYAFNFIVTQHILSKNNK